MNIAQRAVTAVLTDDGREVLKLAAVDLLESASVLVFVQDTDDLVRETKTIGLRS